MAALRRIIFDTSVLNVSEKQWEDFEHLLRGLESGFEVILSAHNADEIVSTKRGTRREALLSRFDRLLTTAKCILPAHEIIRILICAHARNPDFNWKRASVRAREYEIAIPRRDFEESVCLENRAQQFEAQRRWEGLWEGSRPRLDAMFANEPGTRPECYHDYAVLAAGGGGILWNFGGWLYEKVSGKQPTESEVKQFIERCPPFRAACYGLVMASYNGSIRPPDEGPRPPGRIDLLMATYLPYCERFVTADWPQRRDLVEVATEAGIGCELMSFQDFSRSFSLTASLSAPYARITFDA